MSRLPRSKREGHEQLVPSLPRQRFLPGGIIELRPVRHLRCPVCSLQARLELILGGPYYPVAADQRFGGSPTAGHPAYSDRKKREYNRGRIEWTKDIPCSTEELELLRIALTDALETVKEQIRRS